MSDAPNTALFKRGDEAAKELAESTRKGSFPRAKYLTLKAGDTVVVRFLEERSMWLNILVHILAPTRPMPPGQQGSWPQAMDATCRHDPQFKSFGFADCYICDNYRNNNDATKPAKAAPRTWTTCVVREPIVVNGKRIGFKDAQREEIEMESGKPKTVNGAQVTHMVPDVRIVSYGWDQFFKTLQAHSIAYGTTMDRDYFIKRDTKKVGTYDAADYQITPLDKVPVDPEAMPNVMWDLSEDGLITMGKALGSVLTIEGLYPNLPDIGAIVTERISDDYYDRFFDLRHAQPVRKTDAEQDGGSPTSGAEAAAGVPAQPDVSTDAFEAIRARLGQPTAYPTAPSA